MAERRMFAKTIIDSDAFIDMPITARLLYFDLGMRADDDGFVNSPKKIMRMIGASEDDLKILAAKGFIIPFESGVIVIRHWKTNNSIRKDMYIQTQYKKELSELTLDANNTYQQMNDEPVLCNIPVKLRRTSRLRDAERDESVTQNVTTSLLQDRIGKDSLGKDSLGKVIRHFVPPTIDEVTEYCRERKNNVDPERFLSHYEANGWKVGRNQMKDWKAAIRTWERNNYDDGRSKENTGNSTSADFCIEPDF